MKFSAFANCGALCLPRAADARRPATGRPTKRAIIRLRNSNDRRCSPRAPFQTFRTPSVVPSHYYSNIRATFKTRKQHSRPGQEREREGGSGAAAASNYHIMRAWTRRGGLGGTNDCDGAAKSPTTAPNRNSGETNSKAGSGGAPKTGRPSIDQQLRRIFVGACRTTAEPSGGVAGWTRSRRHCAARWHISGLMR